MTASAFDPVWEEELYGRGLHLNLYPFDTVVSFVFRNAPQGPRAAVRVVEVGCGAGNNLWFVAREGFSAAGVDASAAAIEFAQRRFAAEGLQCELRVADFTRLPFEDESADLVIDRGALTCVSFDDAAAAVRQIRRILKPGGRFLFNPYSTRHSSAHGGIRQSNGLVLQIAAGSLVGVGGVAFYDETDVTRVLGDGWEVRSSEHIEAVDRVNGTIRATWELVMERRP